MSNDSRSEQRHKARIENTHSIPDLESSGLLIGNGGLSPTRTGEYANSSVPEIIEHKPSIVSMAALVEGNAGEEVIKPVVKGE